MHADKPPKRPKGVPPGARWVAPLWQYGSVDATGAPTGLWCGWKKTGRLAYVALLKAHGIEGPSLEFHPDGSLYRRATTRAGQLVGEEELFAPQAKSDEPFPAPKPVARVVVDHDAGTTRHFLASGEECNPFGTPLSALFADRAFLVQGPDAFAKSGLAEYVKHRAKVAPSAVSQAKAARQPGLSRDLKKLWAAKPAAAFKAFVALLERGKIPRHLGPLTVEPVHALAAQGPGATAEALLVQAQRNVGALPAAALVAGLVPFGVDGGGNVFCLSVHDDGEALVYSVGREEGDLLLESDDAPTFLLHAAARDADEGKMLSPRAASYLGRILAGHVRRGSLGGAALRAGDFDAKETTAQLRLRRGRWLMALFAGEPIDAVVDAFVTLEAAHLDRALTARLDRPSQLAPPDLIYALLRGVVVPDPRRDALLAAADKSRATLVLSAAALVRELEGGKNRIGKVKDVRTVARAAGRACRLTT